MRMVAIQPRRPDRRSGAHLVEFAVVFPVFIFLVFGLIELGRALTVTSTLTHAARIGCRTAILPGKSTSDATSAVNATMTKFKLSGHTTTVTVNGSTVDASTAVTKDRITVAVAIPSSTVSWLPKAFYVKGTLRSEFTLARE